MSECTGLPWRTEGNASNAPDPRWQIFNENIILAVTCGGNDRANAEYIVLACNSREALLDACKAQHEAIDRLFAWLIREKSSSLKPFFPSQCGQPWEAFCQARAAIEKATPTKEESENDNE